MIMCLICLHFPKVYLLLYYKRVARIRALTMLLDDLKRKGLTDLSRDYASFQYQVRLDDMHKQLIPPTRTIV